MPRRYRSGRVDFCETNCHEVWWISLDPMKMGDLGKAAPGTKIYFQRNPAVSWAIFCRCCAIESSECAFGIRR